MKKSFLKEFEDFEKDARIQVTEMQKISGGTCVFYCSSSFGDCDVDDATASWANGNLIDTDPVG
jgi:hypothetical protein